MSSFTAADVTKQMTAYDTLVRNALDAGTLVSFMEQHLPAIVSEAVGIKAMTDVFPHRNNSMAHAKSSLASPRLHTGGTVFCMLL
jgi:hypothetical protein